MQFAQTNKKPGHLLIDWYLEEGGGVVTTKKEKQWRPTLLSSQKRNKNAAPDQMCFRN